MLQEWFDFSEVADGQSKRDLTKQEHHAEVLNKLHSILEPFLLRRLKADVEISVPPKKEMIVHAPFAPRQYELYLATCISTDLGWFEKGRYRAAQQNPPSHNKQP